MVYILEFMAMICAFQRLHTNLAVQITLRIIS